MPFIKGCGHVLLRLKACFSMCFYLGILNRASFHCQKIIVLVDTAPVNNLTQLFFSRSGRTISGYFVHYFL
jgi:hypothetical protein